MTALVVGVLLTVSTLLAGCGGGGGSPAGSSQTQPPGPTPARFAYVANVADDTVSVLRVDDATGAPHHASYVHVAAGARPRAVAVDPHGRFAYVANQGAGTLSSYAIDPRSGALTEVGTPVAAGPDAMAVAVDPSSRFVYSVNLQNQVRAFRIAAGGALDPLGEPVVAGASPVSVAVHPSGRFVYTANVAGASVSAFAIDPSTGVLSPAGVFAAPMGNPQTVALDAGGRVAAVTNGGAQSVTLFEVDETSGALQELTTVSGPSITAGTAVHPSGRFVYVASQTTREVRALEVDLEAGTATPIDADPVAPGLQDFPAGLAPDQVAVDPTGRALYVTDSVDRSIRAYAIDQETGTPAPVGAARARPGAFGVALATGSAPAGRVFAYAANYHASTVSAYEVETATGVLRRVDADAGTPEMDDIETGSGPVQVVGQAAGRTLYVANSDALRISTYSVGDGSGSLTPVGSPVELTHHPQSIALDPSGRFAYATASNGVWAFHIDAATGALTVDDTSAAGANPVASVVDPTGRLLFVANASADTISTYRIDPATGELTRVDADPDTPEEIQDTPTGLLPLALAAHPSGRFLYVVNRNEGGGGKLGTYVIDATTERLVAGPPADAGFGPRALALDPSGRFLFAANRESGDVWTYAVARETGELTPVAEATAGTHPEAIAVDPSGRLVYTANFTSADLSAYALDAATGRLDPLAGSPFAAGAGSMSVAFAPLVP